MRHGFLLIDKPVGPTSHDMVARVRGALSESSVGHLGTLDPQASGLLVLAVGSRALKTIHLFTDLTKEYEAEIRLGAVSTTYDREGLITEVPTKPGLSIPEDSSRIQAMINDRFVGRIKQSPPAYSAINVHGERAYDLARRGADITLPSRDVCISECTVQSYQFPLLSLHVKCGSGTYIRSLANDIGIVLHFGAYLAALRRTRVGEWSVQNAASADRVTWKDVVPLKEVLTLFPRADLSESQWEDVKNGRFIDHALTQEPLIAWYNGLPTAILEASKHAGKVKPRKVL